MAVLWLIAIDWNKYSLSTLSEFWDWYVKKFKNTNNIFEHSSVIKKRYSLPPSPSSTFRPFSSSWIILDNTLDQIAWVPKTIWFCDLQNHWILQLRCVKKKKLCFIWILTGTVRTLTKPLNSVNDIARYFYFYFFLCEHLLFCLRSNWFKNNPNRISEH